MIHADVRTTDTLDGLVLVPRQATDRFALVRALSEVSPTLRVRRQPEGVWVAAADADRLLAPLPLELRWTPEARLCAENRSRAKHAHSTVMLGVAALLRGGRDAAVATLGDLAGLHVLDDHQWVNVAAMTLPDSVGLCLFDEQGAGKTVSLIYAFDVLVSRDEADFALIVAPKSMVAEWQRDFERFRGDVYRVEILTGTRREKLDVLRRPSDVVVTNFESAVSMEAELRTKLRRHGGRAILVVDESFYIKNLDAQRTRALKRLRELCGRAFVLCGTPAPNAPHDLVEQFTLVDFGTTFGGLRIPEDRQAAAPVVQQAIDERGVFVRHLKQDVLPELPGKTFTRLLLSLESDQERLYLGALRGLVVDVRDASDDSFQRNLPSFLARRSALLQICSTPSAVSSTYAQVPAKARALDELLAEFIERRGEKVVLWSFYRAAIDYLMERYAAYRPVRYDGSVDDVAERRERVRMFQEDDETMLFVANPAAAGAGLTLHRARIAVYESMSNQAAHYLQSLDRIHRRGQDREVEYVILLCDGTIEITEYDNLRTKERAAQDLLRDAVTPPLTRHLFLAQLLASEAQLRKTDEQHLHTLTTRDA